MRVNCLLLTSPFSPTLNCGTFHIDWPDFAAALNREPVCCKCPLFRMLRKTIAFAGRVDVGGRTNLRTGERTRGET